MQGLQTDDFKAVLSGAGTMKFQDLRVKSFHADLSGVGSLQASGTTDILDVRVDGLGSFDADGLKSQTATVRLDGAGSANVWAENELAAYVNGLGSINYYGNPKVSKTIDGLGNVHFMGSK